MNHTLTSKPLFAWVVERPVRKLIYLRAECATHYDEFCDEHGCEKVLQMWAALEGVSQRLHEPFGLWFPEALRPVGAAVYALGVEVPADYAGSVPVGCEVMELPPCTLLVMQGAPYPEENWSQEIGEMWELMDRFDPQVFGYAWSPEDAPRMQLAPMGHRGYIEARPVVRIADGLSAI